MTLDDLAAQRAQWVLTLSQAFAGDAVHEPPAASWGSMLNSAQRFVTQAPWLAVFPGLAVFLAVLAFNLSGDGIRDTLDSRAR